MIFLIVMMIVVTCIIAYLIKLQMNDRYSYEEDDDEDLSEDVLADKEDEIQEDDEDEVVRSISEALKKNEDDLEVLDIQDVDDVDDVKRT